jgi:type II secretory pathway predicted ATPase ExeA
LRKQGAFGFWDLLFPVKLNAEKLQKVDKPVVLLIDEIHKMSKEQEEELKLLADKNNVVIFLAGQNEARKKFDSNRALSDRLVTKIKLKSLKPAAISTLIKVRIQSVGGKGIEPFNDVVVNEIAGRSKGNPREALRICNMVLNAVLAGEKLE